MLTLAHLQYRDYSVYISQSNDHNHIHCFKYNSVQCQYEVFDLDDHEAAADYLLAPMPRGVWGFSED
jgi:hypothetical protein